MSEQEEWAKLDASMQALIEYSNQKLIDSKSLFEYFQKMLNAPIINIYGEQLEKAENGWYKYYCYVKPKAIEKELK